jgi:hypothetical protein
MQIIILGDDNRHRTLDALRDAVEHLSICGAEIITAGDVQTVEHLDFVLPKLRCDYSDFLTAEKKSATKGNPFKTAQPWKRKKKGR